MLNTIFGFKQKQTQTFTEDGKRIPVTQIVVEPGFITNWIKTDNYQSIQLGFGQSKNLHQAQAGIIKKAGLTNKPRFFREIRIDGDQSNYQIGSPISLVDLYKVGDLVKVTSISKGKGFAGVVKRHHFAGGPRTHGQSDRERAPGSIGMTTTPGRVFKGKRMAGRMGHKRSTIKGLRVVNFDQEKGLLILKGLVPGPKGSLVKITKEK